MVKKQQLILLLVFCLVWINIFLIKNNQLEDKLIFPVSRKISCVCKRDHVSFDSILSVVILIKTVCQCVVIESLLSKLLNLNLLGRTD